MTKWTRRQWIQATAGVAFVPGWKAAYGQYPGLSYRDYSRCLPDYLSHLARRAYAERNEVLAGLTSPAAVVSRQGWVRETFWDLVGGEPERTPLNLQNLGGLDRPGYRLEKVIYESRPGLHIPGNFYIPKQGEAPFPGVLFQMGHSLNGKANASYQSCCQGLARLGFLVLAFDPMGQGERTYYPGPNGLTRLGSADDEHTLPGKQMLLLGDTSTRFQVWDAVRSLDVLSSHPLVDPARLASTGQSGGGTLTMLLAAVDERLAAAAVSSGNTENLACADFNPPGSTDDAEQNFIDGPARGFGRWDLLYPMAPRPLLILVSAKDFFGTYSPRYISNGWEEFEKLARVYEVLGAGDRLSWVDSPLPHGFSYHLRVQVYNWFRRWLQNGRPPVENEPFVNPEQDETLWVASTGSVVRSFQGETPFSLNLKRLAEVRTPDEPEAIEDLLKRDPVRSNAGFVQLGRVRSQGLEVLALEVAAAEGVWLPVWLFLPDRIDDLKPILLLVEPQGRNSRWREDQLYQELARNGRIVCVPDLRGVGDLTPEFPRGSAGHGRFHQEEENYAWASLMLGRPLLGQRVTDLLTVVQSLSGGGFTRGRSIEEHTQGRSIVLAARERMTVPALFAAALDERIRRLYLSSGLASFRNLVETLEYSHPFANFLPKMLSHTDLPQLVRSLNPRQVVLAGTLQGDGTVMEVGVVESLYAGCENVVVTGEDLWDFTTLFSL